MRLSVERLRWVLVAAALALVVIVVGSVVYGRYRALKKWKDILAKSGVHVTHDANGVTWSQTENGKTLYTIHTARATQTSPGVYHLHDAELTLYSRTSPRVDHIYGAEFEYDQNTGVARALGEVHMDLQAPEAATTTSAPPRAIRGREGRAPSAPTPAKESTETIHVRTSGLVYVRAVGVAATKEDVEFRYGAIEAHAQGAEFDESASAVHLLANVRLEGTVHDSPLAVTATKADLDRGNELISMLNPVVKTDARTMSAGSATGHLRKDGSVDTIHAVGSVKLGEGDEVVTGDVLDMTLNGKSAPETARLNGHVVMDDTSAARPAHATAETVDAKFDADGGIAKLFGTGGVALAAREKSASGDWLQRTLSGDRVDVALVEGKVRGKNDVKTVHATGHAGATGEQDVFTVAKKGAKPTLAGKRVTALNADDLVAAFHPSADGKTSLIDRVDGTGHARMSERSVADAHSETEANALALVFMPGPMGSPVNTTVLKTANESGDVRVRSQAQTVKGKPGAVSAASAARAEYDGASETLRMEGEAKFAQNGTQVSAPVLTLMQGTGDASAEGGVTATMASAGGKDSSHVLSDRATLAHLANMATFVGTDAKPAKLWQGASQVTAAAITMDGTLGTLSARPVGADGVVTAIFPQGEAAPGAKSAAAPVKADGAAQKVAKVRSVEVRSRKLDYADKTREAVFQGDVVMTTATGTVNSERAVVLMKPKPAAVAPGKAGTPAAPVASGLTAATPTASEVDRVIATGNVRMTEPGRTATGDQMVYMASSGEMVLTGTDAKPPRVVDAEQGNVSGATLLFGTRDTSVVVSGDVAKHGRVRTETEVKP